MSESILNRRLLSIVVFLLLVAAAGCSKPAKSPDRIGIVVSIVPLQEFAEKVGGDKVKVSPMVPPGASPHTYEPTPNQLVEVSKAKMYVKVGSPVEFELVWLGKIMSANRKMPVADASAGIELVGMDDPHIWLSPRNAKIMVDNIYKSLLSVDPDNKDYYTSNKEAYVKELDALDKEIGQMLSGKTDRRFMVYHPAWSYFAKDYDLLEIPAEEGGKEPTAKGMERLIEQAKARNIRVIFASPQFNTESAEVIAREIGGRVVLIDPLEKDYIANTRKVAKALSEAMK